MGNQYRAFIVHMEHKHIQNEHAPIQISRREFLDELREGPSSCDRSCLGKRHAPAQLAEIPSPILADSSCYLPTMDEHSFLRALKSPLESTKVLFKHFVYDSLATNTFSKETFSSLSSQVQLLVLQFYQTHLGGLNPEVLAASPEKSSFNLEETLCLDDRHPEASNKRKEVFRLSIMLGCYLEGLKQQLNKNGSVKIDQKSAVKTLYSVLHENTSKESNTAKDTKSVPLFAFETTVEQVLSGTLIEEDLHRTNKILTSKLLSKFAKLPKKPLRAQYNKCLSQNLSELIDDCEDFNQLLECLRENRLRLNFQLYSAVDCEDY